MTIKINKNFRKEKLRQNFDQALGDEDNTVTFQPRITVLFTCNKYAFFSIKVLLKKNLLAKEMQKIGLKIILE